MALRDTRHKAMESNDPTMRFLERAQYYANSRPSYPTEIIPFLEQNIGFSSARIVADIGSGTGILSEAFLKNENELYAVEPNDEMRNIAEQRLKGYRNFHSISARAEDTTLPSGSIDVVTAGQSFHWFDASAAKKEFKRILVPKGHVIILAYKKEPDATPISKEYDAIVKRYGRDFAKITEITNDALDSFFGVGKWQKHEFRNSTALRLDFNGLTDRFLSASYMPTKKDRSYAKMAADIKSAFEKNQEGGFISIVYSTTMFFGRL